MLAWYYSYRLNTSAVSKEKVFWQSWIAQLQVCSCGILISCILFSHSSLFVHLIKFWFVGDSGDGGSKKSVLSEKIAEISSDNVTSSNEASNDGCNSVNFIVVYNKNKYDITFNSNKTVKELKTYLQGLIGVPEDLQKVMFKGLAKDDQTLKDLDVKSGAKVMVVGSKLDQVLAVSSSGPQVNLMHNIQINEFFSLFVNYLKNVNFLGCGRGRKNCHKRALLQAKNALTSVRERYTRRRYGRNQKFQSKKFVYLWCNLMKVLDAG